MNMAVLLELLRTAVGDAADPSGDPDQPDHLFAVTGPAHDPDLEHLMEVPGRAADYLPVLLELGLEAHRDVLGLVLVSTAGESADCELIGLAMGILRDGATAAVIQEQGGPPRFVGRLPGIHGDHDTLVALALRLLRHRAVPRQSLGRLAPTG